MQKNKINLSQVIMNYVNKLGFCDEMNFKIKKYLKELGLGEIIILKIMSYLNEFGYNNETNNTIVAYLSKSEINEDVINNLISHLNEVSVNYKVINYFLTRNIRTIFGKNEFEENEVETNLVVDSTNNKLVSLKIIYYGKEYIIKRSLRGQTLEMSLKNSAMGFSIIILESVNSINNVLVNINEEESCYEFQNISLKETPTFDYQKVIYDNRGEEIISPAYRTRPIGVKIGNKEVFSVETLDQDKSSYLKGIKMFYKQLGDIPFHHKIYYSLKEALNNTKGNLETINIRTSYDLVDIYDYLDEIYISLEEMNKTKLVTLERKK